MSIIGVLASIAIPTLQKYVYRAQRSEAYLNLKGIYTTQVAYQAIRGRYGATFDEIGFEISGGRRIDANTIQSRYYTYTLTAFDLGNVVGASYQAVATGDLDPGDAILDILMIGNDLTVIE